jgi:hypothetical protein
MNACDLENAKTAKTKSEHALARLVEARRYKPESRGFDWNFSLT